MNLCVWCVTEALFDVFQNPIATNSENCISTQVGMEREREMEGGADENENEHER